MGITHLMKQKTKPSELTDQFDTTDFQPEEHKKVFKEGTLYYVTYDDSTKTPFTFNSWLSWRLDCLEIINGST